MNELLKKSLYQEDLDNILSINGIEKLNGKRVLITGATGLIGVCMIDALMRRNEQNGSGIKIFAVGRNKQKATVRLGAYFNKPDFTFLEQDVIEEFPKELSVDIIIPLASNTHPLAYSKYPVETIAINVKGAENALNKALQCKAIVLYPSTVEVYGNARGNDVFTEDYTGALNLTTSRSCYTESKRVCEAMCLSYAAEYGVDVKVVRLSRVFGPTMLESDTKASSQFIQKALNGENVILKSEGYQFFSYTYVADAVSAMLYVLLHGESGTAYNISNEDCNVHLREFAKICSETVGRKVIFDLPSDDERKGFSVATQAIMDNSRLKAIGWLPKYGMKGAVERTINILSN